MWTPTTLRREFRVVTPPQPTARHADARAPAMPLNPAATPMPARPPIAFTAALKRCGMAHATAAM